MLICPQCKFENPKQNKFCQNCGVSLTHKVCCQCLKEIPIEAKNCSYCGTANHTVLWAIMFQKKAVAESKVQPELASCSNPAAHQSESKIENLSDLFADSQVKSLYLQTQPDQTYNRYTLQPDAGLVAPLETVYNGSEYIFLQGSAIDQYPLQKSHLATLQKQQTDLFAELSQENPDSSYLSVSQYWNLIGLPTHALPYLILEKYAPTVPKIYDAWQQKDQGVVLLPDRSQWKLMTDVWSQSQLSLLQVVWFLDEMAKLWQPLSQVSCAGSLLVDDNLRVDEDQAFYLQQLYMDLDYLPTLKDLGKTWQLCLKKSEMDCFNQLNLLLDKIVAGDIIETEQLRLELHNLSLEQSEIEPSHTDIIDANSVNTSNTSSSGSDPTKSQPHSISPQEVSFFDETEEEMMYSSDLEEQATAMISMHLRDIDYACCTDIGSQRDHNEDFYGIKASVEKTENNTDNQINVKGLYLVCDGMGGHAAGEVASAMAVENLQKYFQTHWHSELPDHETIEEGILLANDTLYQTNIDNARSGSGRMGTTLVMALLQDTQLAIAHVGDSRIYRISHKQGLEQLTLDHEVGQREINRGVEPEIAYGRPDSYQLTQALGPRENTYVRPDIQFLSIMEDCLLLLCSDGLCDNELIEQHWTEHLKPLISSNANLQDGLFNLIDLANEYNGHDNITAILIRVKLKPDF
ncbi:MAG: serine/threonine phosphatase [Cyanobacteria bacterium P01_A01_bin.83]